MITEKQNNLTTIGVFYDGNYFLHVSNYYNYMHKRKSRISVSGLHEYIRYKVAELTNDFSDFRHCQIVDSHYFRGRLKAYDASISNALYYDRIFDDILMREGVTTHYLPVRTNHEGVRYEKGIDVWLALEALELAYYKKFDVLVLIASDGDYTPLIRKLNTLGTKVMLLSWDFEYKDDSGAERVTRTSQDLLDIATYPISMHEEIDQRLAKENPIINNLFSPPSNVDKKKAAKIETKTISAPLKESEKAELSGKIMNIKDGYGFIDRDPENLFFYYQSVKGVDFNDLKVGDIVIYEISLNDKGEEIAGSVELKS